MGLWVFICVLQDDRQYCVPQDSRGTGRARGPGAGLFVAPGISTRRGASASGETNVRRSEYLVDYAYIYRSELCMWRARTIALP